MQTLHVNEERKQGLKQKGEVRENLPRIYSLSRELLKRELVSGRRPPQHGVTHHIHHNCIALGFAPSSSVDTGQSVRRSPRTQATTLA